MESGIDELLGRLGLSDAPIGKWPERHNCAFLRELVEAHARRPSIFGSYLDRVLRFANYWSREKREPIVGLKGIDRRGSFLGGFPWTSPTHPWPTNNLRKPLAPILQLNLATLDTGPLGVRHDTLFQVWAWDDDLEPYCRAVPLAQTVENPDWTVLPWQASDMYYRFEGFHDEDGWEAPTDPEWFEGRIVGEYVAAEASWHFSLGGELEKIPDEIEVLKKVPPEILATWRKLEDLLSSVPKLFHTYYDEGEVLSGFFGGQMYLEKSSYDEFSTYRTLYEPAAGAQSFSEDVGLVIWSDGMNDGKLAVLINPLDHSDLIAVTD